MWGVRCCWFSSTLVNFISDDEWIISNIFYDLFLFFPFLFKFLRFIIGFFIHDSFKKFGILNLNIFELFVSKTLIETFVHSLLVRIYWIYFARSLSFERGLFGHYGSNFFKKNLVRSFNLSKTIFLEHLLLFIVVERFIWKL